MLAKWYDAKMTRRGDVIIPAELRKESGISAGDFVTLRFSGMLGSEYDTRMCRVTTKNSVTLLLSMRERNRIRAGDIIKMCALDRYTLALRDNDKRCFNCGASGRLDDDPQLPYCEKCRQAVMGNV